MGELPPDPFDAHEEVVIQRDVHRRQNVLSYAQGIRNMFFEDDEARRDTGYDPETIELIRARLDALDEAVAQADKSGLDIQMATTGEMKLLNEVFQDGFTD